MLNMAARSRSGRALSRRDDGGLFIRRRGVGRWRGHKAFPRSVQALTGPSLPDAVSSAPAVTDSGFGHFTRLRALASGVWPSGLRQPLRTYHAMSPCTHCQRSRSRSRSGALLLIANPPRDNSRRTSRRRPARPNKQVHSQVRWPDTSPWHPD